MSWVTRYKLTARKRPRLLPVCDSVVWKVLELRVTFWIDLHTSLRANNGELHQRLLLIREMAGVGEHISPLRILDIVAWRHGTEVLGLKGGRG